MRDQAAGMLQPTALLLREDTTTTRHYGIGRRNIINSPFAIEDDADWSPVGDKIAFTRRPSDGEGNILAPAEIYKDGLGWKWRQATDLHS
jgi:hypothetical protein